MRSKSRGEEGLTTPASGPTETRLIQTTGAMAPQTTGAMALQTTKFMVMVHYATFVLAWVTVLWLLKKAYRRVKAEDKRGCFWDFVRWLAVGTETSVERERCDCDAKAPETPRRTKLTARKVVLCFAVINTIYVTWGVLQERIMTVSYTSGDTDAGGRPVEEKFRESEFIILFNRLASVVFAALALGVLRWRRTPGDGSHRARDRDPGRPPFYQYGYSTVSNLISTWCQYEALKYVGFPVQVLAKSCKLVPVMLVGSVVSRRKYTLGQYFTAAGLTVGACLFIFSTSARSGSTVKAVAASEQSDLPAIPQLVGFSLLLVYVLFDSFTSNWQGELYRRYPGLSAVEMMLCCSVVGVTFTAFSLSLNGLAYSLSFVGRHPTFALHLLATSLCSSLGQLAIFKTIEQLGPLVFTTIMTCRQLLSLLVSCLIYEHRLSPLGLLGIGIIFLILFAEHMRGFRANSDGRTAPL